MPEVITTPLAVGDFVATGNIHGRVEKVTEDQILVATYKRIHGGWEATNIKSNHKPGQLTKITALQEPEAQHTRMRVVNRGESRAELILYADIGDSWFGGISSKEFSDQLSAIGDVKNLDVRMNSGGGDVFEGQTIYNRLKQHSAKVTVYVDGLAASIASVIAMAADDIVAYDTSTFMIHKPLTFTGGNSEDLQEVINRLNMVEEQMLDIYVGKTGLDRQHIKNLLSAETWMTGTEAVEMGFADRMEESSQAVAASISQPFDRKWFGHPPVTNQIPDEQLSETVRRAKGQSLSLVSRSRKAV